MDALLARAPRSRDNWSPSVRHCHRRLEASRSHSYMPRETVVLVTGQPVPRHCMAPRLKSRFRETHFQRWAGRLALQTGVTRTCTPWASRQPCIPWLKMRKTSGSRRVAAESAGWPRRSPPRSKTQRSSSGLEPQTLRHSFSCWRERRSNCKTFRRTSPRGETWAAARPGQPKPGTRG